MPLINQKYYEHTRAGEELQSMKLDCFKQSVSLIKFFFPGMRERDSVYS